MIAYDQVEVVELVPPDESDPRIQSALTELRETIARHYPEATFRVVRHDDPDGLFLIPTVDVDDLEDVASVFEDRLIDMQVEEGLPVYVVPDWPAWRIRKQVQDMKQASERLAGSRP